MQKYLADKHEHLKKTSQQLADKTDKTQPGANPAKVDRSSVTNSRPTSFVRSLEDLRSVETGTIFNMIIIVSFLTKIGVMHLNVAIYFRLCVL